MRLLWLVTDLYAGRRLAIVALLIGAAALLSASTPLALKWAIDSFSLQSAAGDLSAVWYIAAYVAGQFLTRGLSELRFVAHGQAQGRIYRNVGLKLFNHLIRLPMRFHLEKRTGAMGQIGEQGIDGCEQLLHNTIFTILPVVVEFVAVGFVLIHFGHPVYLVILGLSAIAYVVVFEKGAAGVKGPAYMMAEARVEAHAAMTDNLLNAEAIKYYDAERLVAERYDQNLKQVETGWRRLASQRAANGLWVAAVFAVSLGTSLIYAAHDVAQGRMSVGDFVLVNTYIVRFVQPLELFGLALREIVRALASLQGLFDVFQEKTEELGSLGKKAAADPAKRGLRLEGVTFSYDADRVVLRGVSLEIPLGRTLAIVGASGAGKSSIIRLLFRLYEPDSGRILLNETPIAELTLSELRRSIAIVPQDTVLFHDSIANNIAFGKDGASEADVREAARIANLEEFIDRQRDGFDTIVGERGLKLSGGERQRIAIARAALKRPQVFVFDEATSSLDTKTEVRILRNLRAMSSNAATLLIAHRLSTVVHADEIAVLHQGAVVERGRHSELLRHGGHYASLWQAQQGTMAALKS